MTAFLTQVAEKGPINAGAANVLKRRIAERLPLDYDKLTVLLLRLGCRKGLSRSAGPACGCASTLQKLSVRTGGLTLPPSAALSVAAVSMCR